ncbi:MAG TPA: phenylalanine 4-monooxygenase [Povalibacter sp.]|uniref:phenylalanine 4-monooxygenase n=1 Tax=Povalibacter sp. TaxID=1962978 RepID=UPI002CF79316|nr:phenylalanine 4-monooxygenase [Povalibacter sp.]HMN46962.1 phenylalanine 4-monooxygenase [Povalibacter sp.]
MANQPAAPTHNPVALRGDYSQARADYTIEQQWDRYTDEDHAIWQTLYARQIHMIERYAAPEFVAGTRTLNALPDRIPRIDDTNRILEPLSGWKIVAVPGLIPEEQFFAHLANRRFPVTVWIRKRCELDYLVEPDIFHDFFGHVPLLTNPPFARFMQAYGEAGPKAIAAGALKMLARLYWYMVEFGLIATPQGLRAYGSGILSSKGETAYSIESPKPHRIAFDLERVLRTDYLIDDYQQTYFVIDSFEQLFHAGYDTDFAPFYRQFANTPGIAPDVVLPTDRLIGTGT